MTRADLNNVDFYCEPPFIFI